jgi:hypothetical protein
MLNTSTRTCANQRETNDENVLVRGALRSRTDTRRYEVID